MSSIIFRIEESQVLVATDTLAVSPEGRPLKFTTKALSLPHLRMVIAGTGAGGFLDTWSAHINSRMLVRGIDHLNDYAPGNLATGWSGYKQQFSYPADITTTVYHFGFSEDTGLIHSYAYRSEKDFKPEVLGYGLGYKPECSIPDGYKLPDDIKAMMDEQRAIQRSLTSGQRRIYIGGEIQIHHLVQAGYSTYTMGRFDDYDTDEKAMYEAVHD